MKKTIIFDLDGTLVDIEPFFFSIFNDLAPIFGYAPILQSEVPKLKLLPLKTLLRKRLGWRIIFFPWIIGRGR
ncbi:MAG: HAD hydrolase-like protein, partial [Candidatus Moranbacteria bacterium]|nr:HAD hydrolase-like protein [Candidatus Moranbacteria bacterium]